MNCRKARNTLLKLSPVELNRPRLPELREHLDHCPRCDAERTLWIRAMRDVSAGAEFHPQSDFWQESSAKRTLPLTSRVSILRRLDWILAPELTYRWALGAGVAAAAAVLAFNVSPAARAVGTLPNSLVLSQGPSLVQTSSERGLHITPNAVHYSPVLPAGSGAASPEGI